MREDPPATGFGIVLFVLLKAKAVFVKHPNTGTGYSYRLETVQSRVGARATCPFCSTVYDLVLIYLIVYSH